MRSVSFTRILFCITFLLLFGSYYTNAQQFKFPVRKFSSRVNLDSIGRHGFPDTVKIEHDLWTAMVSGANYKYKSINDFVKFSINHDTLSPSTATSYVYKMAVQVLGWNNPNNPNPIITYDTLTVTYRKDSSAAYQDQNFKKYNGYHKMWVIITGIYDYTTPACIQQFCITPNSLGNTCTPNSCNSAYTPPGYNCRVEAEIWRQTYDRVPYGGPYPSNNITSAFVDSEKSLIINFWNQNVAPPPAPSMYELEWTYVDDYHYNFINGISYSPYGTNQLNYDFKNNATRVITDQPYYKLPLIFERGYLVYRSRIIRPDTLGYATPIYTNWSIPTNSGLISSLTTGINYYQIGNSHLHDSLNWQYTISFAEEGKFKQVISYFDGSLKNRQTVTRLNSLPNYLITTENIYDFKGRPSISLLPTPVQAANLKYVYGLSINAVTNKPYKAADFDTIQPINTCPNEFSLTPLASNALASLYYSHQNPDTTAFQKFVPDAKGYPLIQTVIAPENDKRILKQGGAGDSLQLGARHYSKYDYVMPEQSELNRLFGTEIGRSEYYKKTVLTDPNGQPSYTVTDNNGKTVATGMIGLGPDSSTHPIDPYAVPTATTITEDLLSGITQTPSNNTWSISKSFYVEASGDHTLQYALTIQPFPVCGGNQFLNVGAYYHYEMYDDCGIMRMQQGQTLGVTGVSTSSTSNILTGSTTTANLMPGKYIVNKYLTVSRDSVAAAVDSFMNNPYPGCLHDVNYFIRNAIEARSFPCPDTLDDCAKLAAKMKADMYPMAKYGKYVINSNNHLDSLATNALGNTIFYFNTSLGKYTYQICDSVFFPTSVVWNGNTYTNLKGLPIDTFINIFNDAIATSLLVLHPDYCNLKNCNPSFDTYQNLLQSLPDYTTAQQLGYFTLDSLIRRDPMYKSGALKYDSLAKLKITERRIDSIAISIAYCGGIDSTQTRICMQQIFNNQVTSGSFNILTAPSIAKESYFKNVIALYLGNRSFRKKLMEDNLAGGNDRKQQCGPCSSNRLYPTGASIFPPAVTSSSDSYDSTKLSGTFANLNTGVIIPPWVIGALSNTSSTANYTDSTTFYYNQMQFNFCDSQVANIARTLINCSLDTNDIKHIRDSLFNYFCAGSGGGYHQTFTPNVVRRIIVNNGVSLSDLCNPYLVDYLPFPSGSSDPGSLTCKSSTFFAAMLGFFNALPDSLSIQLLSTQTKTLSTSHIFEGQLLTTLSLSNNSQVNISSSFDAILRQYHITVSDPNNSSHQVNFWFKKLNPTGTCNKRLDSLDFWKFLSFSCLKDNTQNLSSSMINQFSAFAKVASISGNDSTACPLLVWNDAISLMDTASAGDNYNCITCPEIKSIYRHFQDTLNAYGLCCTDHPFYQVMLKNYVNYSLNKQYSSQDIYDFIASCALADSTSFKNSYGQFVINNITDANLSALITYLNTTYNTSVSFFRYNEPGTSAYNNFLLYFNNLQVNKYNEVKQYLITNYSAAYAQTLPSNTLAYVFIPTQQTSFSLAASSFAPNVLPYSSSDVSVTLSNVADSVSFSGVSNGTKLAYNKYVITYTPSLPYYKLTAYSDSLRKYIYHNAPGAMVFTAFNPLINKDYYLQQKKDFLNYNYALTDTLHAQLISKLKSDSLKANISNYTSKNVTYNNPYLLNDNSDLFISDANQSNTGYSLASTILSTVASSSAFSNPNSGIFISQDSAVITVGTATTPSLKVFRLEDRKTYMYRYFQAGTNQLFTLYIKLPDYIDTPAKWTYTGIELGQGDGGIYRFKADIKLANTNFTTTAYGYSDFWLGTGLDMKKSMLCHGVFDVWNVPDTLGCERQKMLIATREGRYQYGIYRDSVSRALDSAYLAFLQTAVTEQLNLKTRDQKYQFTLYYYDRAGNLSRTVPPAGVKRMDSTAIVNNQVNTDRANNVISSSSLPVHSKSSFYQYNSLNQVFQQTIPDGGTTTFYYDAVGRIVFSQNDLQKPLGNVFYSLYDEQGRVIESGQAMVTAPPVGGGIPLLPNQVINSANQSIPSLYSFILGFNRQEVVSTLYDTAYKDLSQLDGMSTQNNLRKRVTCTKYFENLLAGGRGDTAASYDYAAHYSYDIEGSVKTLTHEYVKMPIAKQRYKRVDYDYDMLSGKINMLSYNRGFSDQFYQRFSYDADNRITKSETSKDAVYWDDDADYQYYKHGPLARVTIGDLRVQGMDYAYTIQGWLKAMNSDLLDTNSDMGRDGSSNSIFPQDAFGYTLDYYAGDYKPIGNRAATHIADPSKGLFNGNIARQTTNLQPFANLNKQYRYDPLNRITNTQYYNINLVNNANTLVADDEYRNNYTYDPDGNLLKLVRMGSNIGGIAKLMDTLTYAYNAGTTSTPISNELINVYDNAANMYTGDLPYSPVVTPNVTAIKYDPLGRRVRDVSSNSNDSTTWSIYNKVKVNLNTVTNNVLRFEYDGGGNRISKSYDYATGGGNRSIDHEYYIRDAAGNILTILQYKEKYALQSWLTQVVGNIQLYTGGSINDISHAHISNPVYANSLVAQVALNSTLANSMITNWTSSQYYSANPLLMPIQNPALAPTVIETNVRPNLAPVLARALKNQASTDLIQHNFRDMPSLNRAKSSWINTWRVGFDSLCTNLGIYSTDTGSEIAALDTLFSTSQSVVTNQAANIIYGTYDATNNTLRDSLIRTWLADNTLYNDDRSKTAWDNAQVQALQRHLADTTQQADLATTQAYFSSYPTSSTSLSYLRSNVGDGALLSVLFNNNPGSFSDQFVTSMGATGVATALSSIPGITAAKGFLTLNAYKPSLYNSPMNWYTNVLVGESFYLAEHHLYGSSRLGIKNYFPQQVAWQWTTNYHSSDSSTLVQRLPWYSLALNEFMQTAIAEPLYASLDLSSWPTYRLLGTKRYEMTDHLGDVQATVMDRLTPVFTGNNLNYKVDIATATDFYPFGQPMPGRDSSYAISTATTANISTPVTTWVYQDLMPVLYNSVNSVASVGNWSIWPIANQGSGQLIWDGSTLTAEMDNPPMGPPQFGIQVQVSTIPGANYTVHADVDISHSGPLTLQAVVYNDVNMNDYRTLNSLTIQANGVNELNFTATDTVTYFSIFSPNGNQGMSFRLNRFGWYKQVTTYQSVLTTLYNNPSDYRFGYNGQMKTNEIAGRGNHYTAMFWEYDPRIARRWNLDPVDQISISNYAVLKNSPLQYFDFLGNTVVDKNDKPVSITRTKDGKLEYAFDASYSPNQKKKVQEQFMKESAPVLEAMNGSEEGYKDIQTLNNIPTLVTIGHSKEGNEQRNSKLSTSGSKDADGFYKSAEIHAYFGNYHAETGDFNEWLGAVMTVETGHLNKEQIKLDETAITENPNYLTDSKSSQFVTSYYPLLNKATDFRIKYCIEKGQAIDQRVFSPNLIFKMPMNESNQKVYDNYIKKH